MSTRVLIFKILNILFAFICKSIIIAVAMEREVNKHSDHWLSGLSFEKQNVFIFIAGLFVIVVGYVVMATGELNSTQSLTISPIMLLIAYLGIIPAAIMYKKRK
jgi:hypothetical protein